MRSLAQSAAPNVIFKLTLVGRGHMGSQRSWQDLDLHCYRRSRCLLIFVLLALPLSATTYYVDNCVTVGSDSNNGTGTSTPWQTIAHVNVQRFNPGDRNSTRLNSSHR